MYKIKQELNKIGLKIKKIETLHGGINSHVVKAEDYRGNRHAIKFYKRPNNIDKRDRRVNEAQFYSYLEKCGIKCIPQLIATSEQYNFNVFSWLSGDKIAKVERNDIEQIVEFIMSINERATRNHEGLILPLASDAYTSALSPSRELEKRLRYYKANKYFEDTLSKGFKNWVDNELLEVCKNFIVKYNIEIDNSIWGEEYIPKYVSPSDIGLHNIIKSREGKINFIDFEYAGRDDISKLIGDLTCNPNHIFTEEQENELIKIIKEKNNAEKILDDYWHKRYEVVKPLIKLKWCFIMTKNIDRDNADYHEKKIIEYYEALAGMKI